MQSGGRDEKVLGITSTVSGTASVLGSWQVCHSICLGIISLLSVIGITLTGMPLGFLTRIAVPMWSVAVILYGAVLMMYIRRRCVSRNLLLINGGLIIAGMPFQAVSPFKTILWVVGGIVVLAGIAGYVRAFIEKKKEGCCSAAVPVKRKPGQKKWYVLLTIIVSLTLIIVFLAFISGPALQDDSAKRSIKKPLFLQTEGNDLGKNVVDTSQSATRSTGDTSPGGVAIDLTLVQDKDGVIIMEIQANTHSVELSGYDLRRMTTLERAGKKYTPSSASSLSGHHAKGIITFDRVEGKGPVTVLITGIPQVMERVFSWDESAGG